MDFQQNNGARPIPSFAPAKDMAQPSPVQGYAAAHKPAENSVQVDTPAYHSPIEAGSDYTVSVDEVLIRLHEIGIDKSKDTIQRYCREGDLKCEKLGMLRRYFATEKSVTKLIEKLQPDAEALTIKQVHEATPVQAPKREQAHAGASVRDNVENQNLHQPAHSDTPADEVETSNPLNRDAPATSSKQVIADQVQIATLAATVDAQESLISVLKDTNKQLWEEVVDSRGNRKDVTKISERMLLTLEAMALGGRLEPPKQDPEPARPASGEVIHREVDIVESRDTESAV